MMIVHLSNRISILTFLLDLNLHLYFIKHSAGEIDIALTVTDAFMVAKSNGRKVKLQGTFVESPLVWAVAAKTEREEVVTVAGLFGISRIYNCICNASVKHLKRHYAV